MTSNIDNLTEQESQRVAVKFIHAEDKIYDVIGEYLSNHPKDLSLIQKFIDVVDEADMSGILWEALGIAVGMVFTAENLRYDWYVRENETNERKVCVCDEQGEVLFYPEQLFHAPHKQFVNVHVTYENILQQAKAIEA